jgi:hypothetical protein
MTAADVVPWISLLISVVTPAVAFAGRHSLKAYIERGVQHHFDRQIERLRAEFRESEERLKSTLRDRESEIAALRATILSGTAGRQALLDKRRFDSVERIWTAVNDLARFRYISGTMATLKVDEIAKSVHDPNIQKFLSFVGSSGPKLDELTKHAARDERPFVPELAWAYFSAYSSILLGNYAVLKVLQTGLAQPTSFINRDHNKRILKAALPHQSQWIDEVQPEAYHYLLEELENNLLLELRKILDGVEQSAADIERAQTILGTIRRADSDQAATEISQIPE